MVSWAYPKNHHKSPQKTASPQNDFACLPNVDGEGNHNNQINRNRYLSKTSRVGLWLYSTKPWCIFPRDPGSPSENGKSFAFRFGDWTSLHHPLTFGDSIPMESRLYGCQPKNRGVKFSQIHGILNDGLVFHEIDLHHHSKVQVDIRVFPKIGGFTPQIIHFNRVFHYKPSILGVVFTPLFLVQRPWVEIQDFRDQ